MRGKNVVTMKRLISNSTLRVASIHRKIATDIAALLHDAVMFSRQLPGITLSMPYSERGLSVSYYLERQHIYRLRFDPAATMLDLKSTSHEEVSEQEFLQWLKNNRVYTSDVLYRLTRYIMHDAPLLMEHVRRRNANSDNILMMYP